MDQLIKVVVDIQTLTLLSIAQNFYFKLNVIQSFVMNGPCIVFHTVCHLFRPFFLACISYRNQIGAHHGQSSRLVSSKSNLLCMDENHSSKSINVH